MTTLNFAAATNLALAVAADALTSFSAPLAVTDDAANLGGGGIFMYVPALAQVISFPALTTLTGQFADLNGTTDFHLVPSFSLPVIAHMDGGVNIVTAANCTAFTMGSSLKSMGASGAANFIFTGAKLTQASVDSILARLAALDGTGGTTSFQNATIDLSGGTSSTPSAGGLTSKATLVGRGCTVTTN